MLPKEFMDVLSIMSAIGLPTIFVFICWAFRKIIHFGKSLNILVNAQQKQMRRDLMTDYHKYMSQGFIEDEDLETWEEGYQAYHKLGQNGIMDSRRNDLIELGKCNSKTKGGDAV